MSILKLFGLGPREEDQQLRELVQGSYKSIRVVGRGTVKIDPREVSESKEFKQALADARSIVNS